MKLDNKQDMHHNRQHNFYVIVDDILVHVILCYNVNI